MNTLRTITLSSLLLSLIGCQTIWENSTSNPETTLKQNGVFPNPVDSNAKKITAKYSKQYNLSDNVIALYPDFNIRLTSTQIIDDETISTFGISSKNGLDKNEIKCSNKIPDKQHLYIEGMHFFYHSVAPGKINIYIPEILMVSKPHLSNNSL